MVVSKLTINFKKTNYVIFHRQQRPVKSVRRTIRIGNRSIDRVNVAKFLGVTVDEHLLFKPHISLLVCRLSKFIAIFYKIRNLVHRDLLVLLYNTLVLPILHTAIVCGEVVMNALRPLLVMQRKVIRVICYRGPYDHTDTLFEELNILRIDQLNQYT